MDTTLFIFILDAVHSAGQNLRAVLLPDSMVLLGVILSMMLTWLFVKSLLGDGFVETVVAAVQMLVTASIIAFFLSAWVTPVPGTSFSVSSFFEDGFNEISKKVNGGVNHADLLNRLLRVSTGLSSVESTCADWETTTTSPTVGDVGESTSACVLSTGGSNDSAWSFSSVLNFSDSIAAVLIRFVAMLVVVITIIFYQLVLVFAMVLTDIGFILGPMLIPFLIWPMMTFLFDGWLKFMITAAMYKVVSSVLLVYVGAIFVGFNTLDVSALNNTAMSSNIQTAKAVGVLVIAGAGLYLMWQIQSIVSMLVGGGSIDMSPRLGRGLSRAGGVASKAIGGASSALSGAATSKTAASAPIGRLSQGLSSGQRNDTGGWGRKAAGISKK